jgi:hypothetical protein
MQQHSKLDIVDEKYQRTLVYCIICLITGEIYVGSTVQTLDERITRHIQQRDCSAWQILQRGNYKAYVIQRLPCNTRREVLTLEGGWQRAYKTSFGEKVVNERIEGAFKDDSPEASRAYSMNHHQEHKEERNAYSRRHYEDNKDERNAYQKKYDEEHKEEQKMKRKRPWTCQWCNKTMTTGAQRYHKKKSCKSKPTHT